MVNPKIVHIITGLNQGGAETVLFRLVSELESYEHKVISLSSVDNTGLALLFKKKGIDVVSLDMKSGNVLPVFSILKLKKLLQQENPLIVQTWMYHANLMGGIAARLAGIKKVIWNIRNGALEKDGEHGKPLNLTTKIGWIVKLGAWFSKLLPSKIICCSKRASEIHKKWGYTDIFHIIHNGINIKEFQADSAARLKIREEFGIGGNIKLVGVIGRFHPQKDIPTFLKAASRLCQKQDNIHFLLAGTGLTQDNLDLCKEIETLHLANKVYLLGRRHDVANVLNALDVLVSSSTFGEAFPNIIAEAMACGLPCVATDVGESGYIIGDLGKVIPPSSFELLTEAVLETLKTPYSSYEVRERIVVHFPIEKMVNAYDEFYRGIIKQSHPS
jgi:glycosyltransferase involved in cell wall biosynthesis